LASKSAPATASTALEGLLFDLAPVAEQAVAEKGAAADQETISAHAVRSLDWGNLETHLEQKKHRWWKGEQKKGMGKENLFKLAWDICLDKNFTSRFCLLAILLLQLHVFRCHTVSLVTCQMAIFVTLPWMNFSLPSWSYLLDLTMDHTKKTLLGTWGTSPYPFSKHC